MPYDFAALTALLEAESPQYGGCELVLRRDGAEVYRRSFGGWQPGARVYIASATKWLTAALMLRLCADEKLGLSLDSRPAEILPGWGSDNQRKPLITLRMLLSHTCGLPGVIAAVNDQKLSLRDCAMQIGRAPLEFEPGSGFYYGECAMQVAGAMAEAASRMGYHELFERQLSGPLGLRSMSFADKQGVLPRNPHLGAGIHCTAQEYALFLQAIWDSWRDGGAQPDFFARALLAEMFADQTAHAARPFAYTPYVVFPGHASLGYGLGHWREVTGAHGQLNIAGSTGRPGTHPWINFGSGMCGSLWFQDDFVRTNALYEQVRELATASM